MKAAVRLAVAVAAVLAIAWLGALVWARAAGLPDRDVLEERLRAARLELAAAPEPPKAGRRPATGRAVTYTANCRDELAACEAERDELTLEVDRAERRFPGVFNAQMAALRAEDTARLRLALCAEKSGRSFEEWLAMVPGEPR